MRRPQQADVRRLRLRRLDAEALFRLGNACRERGELDPGVGALSSRIGFGAGKCGTAEQHRSRSRIARRRERSRRLLRASACRGASPSRRTREPRAELLSAKARCGGAGALRPAHCRAPGYRRRNLGESRRLPRAHGRFRRRGGELRASDRARARQSRRAPRRGQRLRQARAARAGARAVRRGADASIPPAASRTIGSIALKQQLVLWDGFAAQSRSHSAYRTRHRR